ncbi:hypothetical protein P153DRAFT_81119 [Dothidotthia symphoricarpi CBS 119687]|uniref:Nudix hydrolase domain-containing protein n=1 Tax=Dothidotthia symphoricarpi CBS 119687 TaxID=1392245 RepID=A0A6A6A3Y5_9PLEO|nr:uncharacterized protein P153DRAFT_81119 [Dothidotthia symphoricarpi CBS 119687]KAF2126599.1 hypothetical protein P153DRAFT_81119 [Dothidotthia symphoricarpi CBS 119687]
MSPQLRSYLELVSANDNFSYDFQSQSTYYTFHLPHDDLPHGYMHPLVVSKMPWTPSFLVDHQTRTVTLRALANDDMSRACNSALQDLIDVIIEKNTFEVLAGRHSEMYRVPGAVCPVSIERFAAPLFGTIGRGAHLTAYTHTPDGMKIWVPRRSANLKTYPGMLDSTVAGGVRADENPFSTIVHEADEEASLSEVVVRRDVKATGVLTYMHSTDHSFFAEKDLVIPDMLYVYDLELATNMVPIPKDDEVKEFYLMDIEEVEKALRSGEFKVNSAVVMIDFFIRHGIVTEENEQDYEEICMRMHRRLPFPMSKTR